MTMAAVGDRFAEVVDGLYDAALDTELWHAALGNLAEFTGGCAAALVFRLTPSELRVLLAVVEAGSIRETAETLGIAETTAKTHLGHLYAKTGTSRQADLVKLVAGFANPLLN